MFIPAVVPKKPKDFNSYLKPIVDEFVEWMKPGPRNFFKYQIQLSPGIFKTISSPFTGCITTVGGDLPALAALQNFLGHGSQYYCKWCNIRGIYSSAGKYTYSPLKKPNISGTYSDGTTAWKSITIEECLTSLKRTPEDVKRQRQAIIDAENAVPFIKAEVERLRKSTGNNN